MTSYNRTEENKVLHISFFLNKTTMHERRATNWITIINHQRIGGCNDVHYIFTHLIVTTVVTLIDELK